MNKSTLAVLALAVVALVAAPWVTDSYLLHLLTLSGIAAILALSLNLMVGYAGQLSLGHTAFYGIGAYTSALLSLRLQAPVGVGLASAMVAAALLGLAIGPIVLRLRGAYFVMATLSFSIVLQLLVTNLESITNGPMGLLGIPAPALGPIEFVPGPSYYYLVLVCAAGTLFMMRRLVHSRPGRAFVALREHESLAMAVGVNPWHYSIAAWVLGGTFAGLAGALYAHYSAVITPDLFGFATMVAMLVMVVLGGMGTLSGPILGALIVTILPEELRLAKELRLSIFGMLLMATVLLAPEGVVGLVDRVRRARSRRRRSASPAGAAPGTTMLDLEATR